MSIRLIALTIVAFFLLLVWFYFWWRLVSPLQVSRWLRRLSASLLLILVILAASGPILISAVFLGWVSGPSVLGIQPIAFLAMAFVVFLFHACLIEHVLGYLIKAWKKPWMQRWYAQPLTRLIPVILALGAVIVGFVEARHLVLESHTIEFARLPAQLQGLRIAVISDLHLGPEVTSEFSRQVVARVNALHPDLVMLVGDVADEIPAKVKDVTAPLAGISATMGRFYVVGNHEHYWGAQAWCKEMSRLGFTPLVNEHRVLDQGQARLVLGGTEDFQARHDDPPGGPNPEHTFAGAPIDAFRILLAHQPNVVKLIGGQSVDLQISGHTHGGQFVPWFFWCFSKYFRGMYQVEGTTLYISRGTGSWGAKVRLGSPPEITLLELRQRQ